MSSSRDLDSGEYRALADFRFQLRRFLQFSEDQARAAEIEPQQHQLLLAIKGLPDGHKPTIRELSGRLMLKHHSTGELVDRLERRGAVHRSTDPKDARAVLITLTETGEHLLAKLARAHREELESAGPELIRSLRTVIRTSRNAEHLA
jgi:DNA-binding MarR family transcriptional regulator